MPGTTGCLCYFFKKPARRLGSTVESVRGRWSFIPRLRERALGTLRETAGKNLAMIDAFGNHGPIVSSEGSDGQSIAAE